MTSATREHAVLPAAWFWLYPWLDALGRGDVMRRAASMLLRVAAWVVLVFGAIAFLAILRLAFTSELPARAVVAALVLGVIIAGAAAAMHQVFLYHVRDVEHLSDARFVMIPIVAVLARTGGELFAVWWVAAGVGGFLVLALAGPAAGLVSGAADVIPGMPSLPFTGWLGMIWFLLWCGAVGVIGLLLAYLWAEGLTVVADIANRLHALTALGPAAAASSPSAAAAPAPERVVPPPPVPPPAPPPPPEPRPTPMPQERATPAPPPAVTVAPPPPPPPAPRPTPPPVAAPETQVVPAAPSPPTRIVTPAPAPPVQVVPATLAPETRVVSAPAPPTQLVTPPPAPVAPPPQTYAERGEGGPSTVILGPPRKCGACGATTTLVMAKFCEDCGARL